MTMGLCMHKCVHLLDILISLDGGYIQCLSMIEHDIVVFSKI